MLKPEQARRQLEKVRSKSGAKRRWAALARLPKKLADVGRALLGRDARGAPTDDGEARRLAHLAAGDRLDDLTAGERQKLFEALFPKLAIHVESAWQLGRRLPYDSGPDRKPFRAPRHPALTRAARTAWLVGLLDELEGYEKDITWLAAWAGFLSSGYSADQVGVVLAAAVEAAGKEGAAVLDILRQSACGTHPVGAMGRHVARALLIAEDPQGWDFIGRLLADGDQPERVRQTILETIEEAHPEAFRRMLRLIMEHDLARHEDAVQALSVWFGFSWGAVSVRVVNRVLERVIEFLGAPRARAQALQSDDSETVYLGLWAMAFADAAAAVKPAAALLRDPNVERRFVAAHLLAQLQIPAARRKLLTALEDDDLRVALCALEGCERGEAGEPGALADRSSQRLFEPVQRLLTRLPPDRAYLEPIVWPWQVFTADRQTVAASLVNYLGKRPARLLVRHVPDMDAPARRLVIQKLGSMKKWDDETCSALMALAEDSSPTVREAARSALARKQIRR
jgi:hypothetical protein